jgi:hypothetical protein
MSKLGQISQSADSPHIFVGHLGDVDRVCWNAALMLGAGRMDDLRNFIQEVRGQGSEVAYQLSLGLARLDGDKELFEDLAVEYAVNLGVNPPNWIEQHNKVAKSENQDQIIQVGDLTFEAAIEVTIKMESPWPARIDMSEVKKFEEQGLELFNESMSSRSDRNLRTKIKNGDNLAGEIFEHVKKHSLIECKNAWDFLFMYYKLTGQKTSFETAASVFQKEGGKKLEFTDLSEKDDAPEVRKTASAGIPVGDKLANLNQDFAKKSLKMAASEKDIISDSRILFDFAYVRTASLTDIDSLSSFLTEMDAASAKVHFANVNEIVLGTLNALGVEQCGVTLSAPGAI